MRIIAGELKGRKLETPDWPGLRPTSDRLRETIFNVVASRIPGARVLDGYAGTGAVGIEALSRGAAHVTFVERDPRAARLIAGNLDRCGLRDRKDRYAIIRASFADAVRQLTGAPFEVVFLDPPYGAAELREAVLQASALTAKTADSTGLVVVEHARRDAPPADAGMLQLVRQLTSSDSALAFYRVLTDSDKDRVNREL
jgi:16S rRNA (guanine966-N2)-methyltransferase